MELYDLDGKGSLYDPGLHVPLIARWPGHIKPGVTRTLIIEAKLSKELGVSQATVNAALLDLH